MARYTAVIPFLVVFCFCRLNVNGQAAKSNKKLIGNELFKGILDTMEIKPLTKRLLIGDKWIFKPSDVPDCISYLLFEVDGKGKSYDCELGGTDSITYKIVNNKLLVSQYGFPSEDYSYKQKVKLREDTYHYNGHSLTLTGSYTCGPSGRKSIPKIEVVIAYSR
jgi:hypothetical protein